MFDVEMLNIWTAVLYTKSIIIFTLHGKFQFYNVSLKTTYVTCMSWRVTVTHLTCESDLTHYKEYDFEFEF